MAKRIELLGITKHGDAWKQANLDRLEYEMQCPQCKHTREDAFKNLNLPAKAFQLIKVYAPLDFTKETWTDVEFKCNKCNAEFVIQIKEIK